LLSLSGKPAKIRFAKTCVSEFRSHRWVISETGSGEARADFIAVKRELRLPIACVQSEILQTMSAGKVVDKLERDSIHFRTGGSALVSILNFELPAPVIAKLSKAGVVVIAERELNLVTDLEWDPNGLPLEFEERQALLLRSNAGICLSIANRFHKGGDIVRAIEWAERGIDGSDSYSGNYVKLFELLLEKGDLEGAETIGRRAIALRPNQIGLLGALQRLALRQNDMSSAAAWSELLVEANATNAMADPIDLAGILQKQKAARAAMIHQVPHALIEDSIGKAATQSTGGNFVRRLKRMFLN